MRSAILYTLMISVFVIAMAFACNFYKGFVGGLSATAGDIMDQVELSGLDGVSMDTVEQLEELDAEEVSQQEQDYLSTMLQEATDGLNDIFDAAAH